MNLFDGFGNTVVNGNWGLGTGDTAQFVSGTLNGRADFQGSSSGSTFSATITGGVHTNVAAVGTALATINSLSSTLGAETGNSLAITGKGQTINATSGHLDGSGNYVFKVTSLNLNGGITINGSSSQFVVLNFNSAGQNVSLNGDIKLTGGISADHVLFNLTGNGGRLNATLGEVVNCLLTTKNLCVENADFLFPRCRWNSGVRRSMDACSVVWPGTGFEFELGSTLNAPIPEPGTASLVLGGLGLMGLALASRRRR